MRPWIQEKLERMEALYPPERIAQSKARWRALWLGEAPLDRIPFTFSPIHLPYYDAGIPWEKRLAAYLDEMLIHGELEDDFIPCFFPGCRQATIPSMMGAEEIIMYAPNGTPDFACRPAIAPDADPLCLPTPSLAHSIAQAFIDMQRIVLEETEGRLHINICDMQGPADVAGQLWSYTEMLAAAYESPEVFHSVMRKATDAFCLFLSAQRACIGEALCSNTHLHAWSWMPFSAGASLSMDSIVMVSPAFYEEFFRPYVVEIARRFGGVVIHSCGNFAHMFPTLCATEGVRGIHAGTMSLRDMVDGGLPQEIVACCGIPEGECEQWFPRMRERKLRANLSVWGLWGGPRMEDWDWSAIRKRAQTINDLARMEA